MMYGRTVIGLVSMAVLVTLSSGCQKATGPVETAGDPGELEDLVYNTSALLMEKDKFDDLFAEGATLSDKDRSVFKGLFVKPEQVNIDGDTATIEVIVGEDINDEYAERTVTWEAKKEGEAWKLTKAPLQ